MKYSVKNDSFLSLNGMYTPMLDKKDLKILEALRKNARASTQKIARKTLIPITTVHNRIKKLEKEGVIESYTIKLDQKKLGKALSAYVTITVDYIELKKKKLTQHDLAKKLRKFSAVEDIAILAGGADILIKIHVADIAALDSFVTQTLRTIDGIEKTQTMIVLKDA
jgi:Lrp/AsnC family leucine-responsive transcriptional regulator